MVHSKVSLFVLWTSCNGVEWVQKMCQRRVSPPEVITQIIKARESCMNCR